MQILLLFTFLFFLLNEVPLAYARCPDHSFIGCMLRLKTQRVPIEKNIMSLVFNIGSEARLLHTCKVYSATLPCFQDKILECGDEKQKRTLNEVSKTIMYLCSPFSLQRQRAVIKNQKCISAVLSMPSSTGCQLEEHHYGRQVLECKKECTNRGSDFICMMRTWISEQNVCTLRDIDEKCGESASTLFKEFQNTVFEPSYPVVCNYGNDTLKANAQKISVQKEKKIKHRKQSKSEAQISPRKSKTEVREYPIILSSTPSTTTAENIYIAPPTALPSSVYRRPQKPLNYSNLTNPNLSFYPNPTDLSQPSNIWQKQGGQQIKYNKEMWRQKSSSSEIVFTTQHPLFTTTEAGVVPRRHKVIDILRSLIPASLPSQLTALLENSYDKETFPESLNTPPHQPETYSVSTEQAIFPTEDAVTLPTTMIPPKPVPIQQTTYQSINHNQFHLVPTTPKWKPWYLGGV